MKGFAAVGLVLALAVSARSEIQVVDGVRYECRDGLCTIVDDGGGPLAEATSCATRTAQGYMPARDFLAWLKGGEASDGRLATSDLRPGAVSFWILLFTVVLGGLAMNLTPCVLPMIPVNLLIIGKSAARGAWYSLGITLAYGALGVAAAIGGLAFGTIQASPWFNLAVAVVFGAMAVSLSGLFAIDFSRFRPSVRPASPSAGFVFPLFMGALSAVLAGACVAPILISVLLLTGKLYAEGCVAALGLPFLFGLGMALPWPFLGAGLAVLPKPGAWMRWVNRLFAVAVLGFAFWYVRLAWNGFRGDGTPLASGRAVEATPATFAARLSEVRSGSPKPVLVDCWASWCKNCAAMDWVLRDPEVARELERFSVMRLRAERIGDLRSLGGFESVKGLPAFVIFDGRGAR